MDGSVELNLLLPCRDRTYNKFMLASYSENRAHANLHEGKCVSFTDTSYIQILACNIVVDVNFDGNINFSINALIHFIVKYILIRIRTVGMRYVTHNF